MSDTTAPQAPPPSLSITYPAILPISERHDELLEVIRDHQVVIVAGETGSGKSTQLPKMCLELGRGVDRLIGHTQPRRVAARTIAERVADELGTELGTTVGYTVRFTDRVGPSTMVKVMTDGILLAEIQRDRMLQRYDTLIIDEAHERSLNIDFILGYLRQLLPKRPDLKLIVTSATIDTERFAAHFAHDGVPAPIIEVTGRTYPVELRYRPYGVDHFGDDPDARRWPTTATRCRRSSTPCAS
jgi:ATP-dependent helicase HrpA